MLSFSPQDVAEGTEVELEHTDDRKIARQIALDHLREDPRYYAKLKHIERGSIWGWDAIYRP